MATAAEFNAHSRVGTKSIPLECVLCPTKPKFSDTSHLLTHVSSKAHLHHKFNTEFQAKAEPAIRETLRRYEKWYIDNDIESLLQERLAAKDQKKTSRRGRVSTKGSSKSNLSREESQSIKPDPEGEYAGMIPSMGLHWDPVPNDPSFHVHGARPPIHADSGYFARDIKQDRSPYGFPQGLDDPFQTRQMSSRAQTESTDGAIPSDVATQVTAEVGEEAPDASTKLKGTVFPGMHLFDAATPEQKRKRNQRKDGSVLEQMKLTSEAVTALECIWTPEGAFQRSRDIYATPSIDGSPVASPAPKRRNRARRRSPSKNPDAIQSANPDADDGGKPKRKRGKRPVMLQATNVRQTRSSVKKATAHKKSATEDTNPNAVTKLEETDDEVKVITATREKKASFDVFRDPPQNGGQQRMSPLEDMQSNRLGTAATPWPAAFSPDDGSRFGIDPRPVLHTLSSNTLVSSSAPQLSQGPQHDSPLFGSGMVNQFAGFRPSASFTAGYMAPQQGIVGSSFNPLCAQPPGGLSYHSYHPTLYEGKTPTSSFQPINTRMEFSAYTIASNSLGSNTNQYTDASSREQGNHGP